MNRSVFMLDITDPDSKLNITDIAIRVVLDHLVNMKSQDQDQVFKLIHRLRDRRVKNKQPIIFEVFKLFGIKEATSK